jgi:hypothetical protein
MLEGKYKLTGLVVLAHGGVRIRISRQMKRKISREMNAGPVYITIAKEGPVESHGKKKR